MDGWALLLLLLTTKRRHPASASEPEPRSGRCAPPTRRVSETSEDVGSAECFGLPSQVRRDVRRDRGESPVGSICTCAFPTGSARIRAVLPAASHRAWVPLCSCKV